MPKKQTKNDGVVKTDRPKRAKLSPEETLKRMEEFPSRRDKFVAAIQKGKDRPKRLELSREEILKRMRELPLRKDKIIAAVLNGKS